MADAKPKRRELRAQADRARKVESDRAAKRGTSTARRADNPLGRVGERPQGLFGPVPVSELIILVAIVVVVYGFAARAGKAQEVGILLLAIGVFEVTAREHLSGYKSHTALLAFLPAVIVEALYSTIFGTPHRHWLLLVPVVPVFLLCFTLLRWQFRRARHARVVGR